MAKNTFKSRRVVMHRQMGPGHDSGWFEVPLTDLGHSGKGAKKAWVRLPANCRSTGWAEKPGFGKLCYDFAVEGSRANAFHPPLLLNEDATDLLRQSDTVLIGKQRPLTSETKIYEYAWLAPDRGYLQPYLEIREEHVAVLCEQASDQGISIDEYDDIVDLGNGRVQVLVHYATGKDYAESERRFWDEDPELQETNPNPDWDDLAQRYDAFWPLAKTWWA